jgi:uncharacterized membrane protein YphA (DoxX/SURF4 family)
MFQSLRHSQWVLRIGLAAVFLWFGANKFIDPQYWVDAWMPHWTQSMVMSVGAASQDFIFFLGIFEVLVAASLVTGFFMRVFSSIAIFFLLAVLAVHGINEITARDLAVIGGLLALVLWPERTYI